MELLERSWALDALSAARSDAAGGSGRLVLLSGEAGLGKTALLERFTAGLDGLRPSATGHCEPLSVARPLAPIEEIARRLRGRLPQLIGGGHSAMGEIFEELAVLRPGLIAIEDAHWADQASLDLIRYMGRRIERTGLLLVVTYRDDEIAPGHGLRAMLGDLATVKAVRRLALAPLSAQAVTMLAKGRDLDAASLHARTNGNPFLVRELLSEPEGGRPPQAIRDLVRQRLTALSPSARRLVEQMAVAERAGPGLMQHLAFKAVDVDDAVAGGLLIHGCESLGFRHELTREAVLVTLAPTRRIEAHRSLLQAWQAMDDPDPGRLFHHALGAQDAAAIREHAVLAAEHARAMGSFREAAEAYGAALRFTPPNQVRDRALLLEAYARAKAPQSEADAITALREALSLWQALGDAVRQAVCLRDLAVPLVRSGRNDEADACSLRAIQLLEDLGDSADLAGALRVQAHLRMLDRDKAQALHFGRRAIRMAQTTEDMATLASANMTVGTTLLVSDDAEGRPYLDRALSLAQTLGLPELQSTALLNIASSYGEQLRLDEAESALAQGLAWMETKDLDNNAHYLNAWQAVVRLHRGDLHGAARLAQDLLGKPGLAGISRITALAALGRAQVRLGDPGSRHVLDEALALADRTGALQRLAPVRLARAEAAWLAGDNGQARAEADALWGLASGHRHAWHGGEVAYWQALTGEPSPVPGWIAQPYADEIAGRWRDAAAFWAARGLPYEQARALSHGDPQAQGEALRLFDEMDARPAAGALRQAMRQAGRAAPRGPRPVTRQDAFGLTGRQQEIAGLIAKGLSNPAIARALRISPKTVETHVSAILAKLGVETRVEAGQRLVSATPP